MRIMTWTGTVEDGDCCEYCDQPGPVAAIPSLALNVDANCYRVHQVAIETQIEKVSQSPKDEIASVRHTLAEECDVDWGSATASQRCTRPNDHSGVHIDSHGHEWGYVANRAGDR